MTWGLSLGVLALLATPTWGARSRGAPPAKASEDILERWEALQEVDLDVQKAARAAFEVTFTDGEVTYSFQEGYLFRVAASLSGDEERTAGFAFVGAGEMTLSFPEPHQAVNAANRMVLQAGVDPAEVSDIAEGAPLTIPIQKGVVLSVDPAVAEFVESLPIIGDGLGRSGLNEVGEILVTDTRQSWKDEFNEAQRMLRSRLHELKDSGFGPRTLIAADLLLIERAQLAPSSGALAADFRIERRIGRDRALQDRWVTHLRDGSGRTDGRMRSRTFIYSDSVAPLGGGISSGVTPKSLGQEASEQLGEFTSDGSGDSEAAVGSASLVAQEDLAPVDADPDPLTPFGSIQERADLVVLAGSTFPPTDPADPLSPPAPEVRPLPVQAETIFKSWARMGRHVLDVEVDNLLTFEAVGGDLQHVILSVPREELKINTFAITAVADFGGQPLDFVRLDRERSAWDHAGRAELVVFLPEPIWQGEQYTLVLSYRDTWALSKMTGPIGGARNAGSSTGLHRVIPLMEPYGRDTAWSYRIQTRLPEGSRQVASVTGETIKAWTENEWDYAEAVGGPATWPGVAIGEWVTHDEPAAMGLPAIRVNLLREDSYYLEVFAPEMRRAVSFYQRLLPDLHHADLELYQGSDIASLPQQQYTAAAYSQGTSRGYASGAWTPGLAPDGVLSIARLQAGDYETRIRNHFPEWEAEVLAEQMARQWWGGNVRPAHPRDRWIVDALSATYAQLYLQAAFGRETYETRLETSRDIWQRANPPVGALPLVGAASSVYAAPISYHVGPYAIGATLRELLGEEVLLEGLDHFQARYAGQAVSTEQLKAALEETSGRDLTDFFEFWVYGGWLPTLEAIYALDDAGPTRMAVIQVESGVPFGALEVPVRVTLPSGEARDLRVAVVDGKGRVELEVPAEGKIEVEVDPDRVILARDYGEDKVRMRRLEDGEAAGE